MWKSNGNGKMDGAVVLSLISGTAAVAASSCCALPVALSLAGVGGAWLGMAGDLGAYNSYLLGLAVVSLTAGWLVALRRQNAVACAPSAACARPTAQRLTLRLLAIATLLVAIATAWPWIEPIVLATPQPFAQGAT